MVLGLLASIAFGSQDPENVDPDLISPPVYKLLHALPHNVKERLCVPLKFKRNAKDNSVQLTGITNANIDLSDESLPKSDDKEYARKISVMTA